MQFKIFNIPIPESEAASEEMNRFLRGNRIVAVEKQMVCDGDASARPGVFRHSRQSKRQKKVTQRFIKIDTNK